MLVFDNNDNNINGDLSLYTSRPFALRGHVISFLWKWKLYDFAFKKQWIK